MSMEIVKWKPSNHNVGDSFIHDWCGSCVRGQVNDAEPCDILARTMWLEVEDPDYPEEWQRCPIGGPICTAHVELGQEVPERCKHTVDMFDGKDLAA